MHSIDLNCDMGEGFGQYSLGNDAALMPYLSSVNIACGFHAGDPSVMRKTVRLAIEHGVSIGAHPGLPDLQGFGRRIMHISPDEAYEMVLYQIGALWAIVEAEGGRLQHVKPHGALYNMAASSPTLAEAIARAVHQFNAKLVLYGLAGSELIAAGERLKLRTAAEAFADRTYQPDGSLTPRTRANAVIESPQAAAAQALQLVAGKTTSLQGKEITLTADTLCIHGDTVGAVEIARKIYEVLTEAGIAIRPIAAA